MSPSNNQHNAWSETPIGKLALKGFNISTDSKLEEAITTLQDPQTHCLMVVGNDDKIKGIFTEETVLKKVIGQKISAQEKVEAFMDDDFVTISEDAMVSEAIDSMGQKGLKYLPIVDKNDKPIGIISVRWLVDYISDIFPGASFESQAEIEMEKAFEEVVKLPLSFVLTSFGHLDCLKLSPVDEIAQAITRLQENDLGAAQVFEDGELVGLLRVRDIPFKVLHRDPSIEKMPVADFMTKVPEEVNEEEEIQSGLDKISNSRILFLTYKSQEQYGILTARDIVSYIYSHIHDDE